MPRPDYECFVNSTYEVFYNNDFEVKTGKNTPGFYYPFCKIVDLRSKVISAYTTEDDRLWIDIFPVDGLPDDLDEVDKLYKKLKNT